MTWSLLLAGLPALYAVTVLGPPWAHRVALGTALTCSVLVASAHWLGGGDGLHVLRTVAAVAAGVVAVWAIGLVRRVRREHRAALQDWAERIELQTSQQTEIATAQERTRIAREMHDLVAHSLSVIIAQADGGRYTGTTDAAGAVRSLEIIAETGRAALTDMRAILGVLRRSPEAPDPPRPGLPEELSPQPTGADLDGLVRRTQEAGLAVSLVRVGQARPLPAGAGLTLYRICQEALTNVLKHAGPAPTVTVLVRWSEAAVDLTVTDDGRGASAGSDGTGHGLLGMRERAEMFGGRLSAGPRPGGGFGVHAHVPLPSGRPTGWEQDDRTGQ